MQEMFKCIEAGEKNIVQCTSIKFDNDYQCCILEVFFEPDKDSKKWWWWPKCVALNDSIYLLIIIYEYKNYKTSIKYLLDYIIWILLYKWRWW